MKFCSQCGSDNIILKVPEGDNRPRYICGDCSEIFYQNPKIVAGAILEWQDRILLCRRAIQPRVGFWTYPGGFMENAESVVEAARREAQEEAGAVAEDLFLHSIYSLKHTCQVYIVYRGKLKDGKSSTGEETSEVKLYTEDQIPWELIAFPVIYKTLELFVQDRKRGEYSVHQGDITLDSEGNARFIETDALSFSRINHG